VDDQSIFEQNYGQCSEEFQNQLEQVKIIVPDLFEVVQNLPGVYEPH